MSLRIDPQPIGTKLHRLAIYYQGQFLGEYERTQSADIARKTEEIKCALVLLIDIHREKGEFQVRWDGARGVKSIRVDGLEVGQIPKDCWRKASWQ